MKKDFIIDTSLYFSENILSGIQDFSEVATMNFFEDVLSIEGKNDQEIQEVFLELMNYIISL